MSCRVLGRQMEKFMFDQLLDAAQKRGIEEIVAVYRRTPKNGLVREHYLNWASRRSTRHPKKRATAGSAANAVRTATHISITANV